MSPEVVDAVLFDAYGTLFDVHTVVATCERLWPGRGTSLSLAWRAKQLEYTWLRSLMRRYRDFAAVTRDALAHACATLGLPLGEAEADALMRAYLELDPFPDVVPALAALRPRRLAILSNGSPAMLAPLVARAGLDLDLVISVDELGVYKPAPEVYELGVRRVGAPRERVGFVSANGWDAAGAAACGLRVFWIDRAGAPPERLEAPPAHVVRGLADVAALVG